MSRAGDRVAVHVLLFAAIREATGTDRVRVEVSAPATAGAALAALVARYPVLAGHRASLRLAVNSEYVDPAHPLAPGDEMALIPPTCGG